MKCEEEGEGKQESPFHPRSLCTWLPTGMLVHAATVSPLPKTRAKLLVTRPFSKGSINEITPVTNCILLLLSSSLWTLAQALDLIIQTWALTSGRGLAFLHFLSRCSWTCLLGCSKAGRNSGLCLSADCVLNTNARSPGARNWRYGLFMSVVKVGEPCSCRVRGCRHQAVRPPFPGLKSTSLIAPSFLSIPIRSLHPRVPSRGEWRGDGVAAEGGLQRGQSRY